MTDILYLDALLCARHIIIRLTETETRQSYISVKPKLIGNYHVKRFSFKSFTTR
jgi:hypothetical protein